MDIETLQIFLEILILKEKFVGCYFVYLINENLLIVWLNINFLFLICIKHAHIQVLGSILQNVEQAQTIEIERE